MAIRFDGQGFFDDRFLGVNIREEISRLFKEESDLFVNNDALEPVVRKMVWGELPHPAKVYRRRPDIAYKFNATPLEEPRSPVASTSYTPRKLILRNRLSPGDILVMTASIRALHVHHPKKFLTDIDTPCNSIFENNPYITKLNGDGQVIDMHYPLISNYRLRGFSHPGAGISGRHFSDGHRKYLEEILEIEIPRAGLLPDIFLTQDEKLWPSPVMKEYGYNGQYWVVNAGSKSDYTLKQYHRWQEVVDLFKEKHPSEEIVQIGVLSHNHSPLKGTLDMRGKTSDRDLFRTIFHSQGVLTCISYPMHIAAALEKPCVVVAGGRESPRWEMYPSHRFLYTNGSIDCCLYDGCWKDALQGKTKREDGSDPNCLHPLKELNTPLCFEMIRPEDIVRAMEFYYMGGILKADEVAHV